VAGVNEEAIDRVEGLSVIDGEEWRVERQASCWRTTGDLTSLLYDSSAITFGNPFVQKVTQSEPFGCAIVLRRNST
jgi:hypothetical protein